MSNKQGLNRIEDFLNTRRNIENIKAEGQPIPSLILVIIVFLISLFGVAYTPDSANTETNFSILLINIPSILVFIINYIRYKLRVKRRLQKLKKITYKDVKYRVNGKYTAEELLRKKYSYTEACIESIAKKIQLEWDKNVYAIDGEMKSSCDIYIPVDFYNEFVDELELFLRHEILQVFDFDKEHLEIRIRKDSEETWRNYQKYQIFFDFKFVKP